VYDDEPPPPPPPQEAMIESRPIEKINIGIENNLCNFIASPLKHSC
jgi:hypothetical protein